MRAMIEVSDEYDPKLYVGIPNIQLDLWIWTSHVRTWFKIQLSSYQHDIYAWRIHRRTVLQLANTQYYSTPRSRHISLK